MDIRSVNSILKPYIAKTERYRAHPLENPHCLTEDEQTELELLHYSLETALWRLRFGEIEEKLQRKQINILEFTNLTREESAKKHPYKYI